MVVLLAVTVAGLVAVGSVNRVDRSASGARRVGRLPHDGRADQLGYDVRAGR
jgi:hypothetical protein